jgi:general secretion pathway protein G
MKRSRNFLKNQSGMSLIEILIVLSIIAGAMAAIFTTVFSSADKAKIDQAKAEITKLSGYVKLYKMDTGKYPTTEEGLDAVADAGFMEEVPADPWKSDYEYESPGSHGKKFEICSLGPDEDDDVDDICNYKKDEE